MNTACRPISFLIVATTCAVLSIPGLGDFAGIAGAATAAPAKAGVRGESLEAWTDRITKQVKQNWHPPQCNVSENAVMYCDIDASGKIIGTKLQKSSGVKSLDESAAKAFADTAQVSPPPVTFPKGVPAITVEITFDYKVQHQQQVTKAAKGATAKPAIAVPPAAAQTPTLDTSPPAPTAATETTTTPTVDAVPAAEAPVASPPMEMSPAAPPDTPTAETPAGAAGGVDPFETPLETPR